MKNLTIVIHAGVQQALADSLQALEQVEGFTFSHVEGHSQFSDQDPLLSARDKVVGYVPRVRVEILLADENVKVVLEQLLAQDKFSGQGVYWVTTIDQQGRL